MTDLTMCYVAADPRQPGGAVTDLPLFGPTRSYHTRGSRTTAEERAHGERAARDQEAEVLAFFRANPGAWSPSQVHERVFPKDVPLTSTRRAMTNLADKERHQGEPPLLKMEEERRRGPFGRPEHLWRLS